MSNFWDKQEEIGRVTKNKREEVVVSKCERQGKHYVDVRIYAKKDSDSESVPTSKGFAIERDMAKEIKTLMQRACHTDNCLH